MSLRLAIHPAKVESLESQRPSIRPMLAAQLLDVDVSTVYKLLKAGELDGHTIGARGRRIFADSVRSYQERNRLGGELTQNKMPKNRQKTTPWRGQPQKEAEAYLRDMGVL